MPTANKQSDAAEAALSAIEEALAESIGSGLTTGSGTAAGAGTSAPAGQTSSNTHASSPVLDEPAIDPLAAIKAIKAAQRAKPRQETEYEKPVAAIAESDVAALTRPANDDRREIGEVLQTLQTSASSRAFFWASLGTVTWLGASGYWAGEKLGWSLSELLTVMQRPEGVMAAIGLALPVAALYGIADLSRRAHEMKNVAQSMAKVTMRLVEPESMASDAVFNLSQAIRREVAAMGDGIERAVARASELETIVHTEIATIETAYNQNEVRLRTLIDDLSSQREAIVYQADRLKQSIAGTHEGLSTELNTAADRLSATVGDAGARVSMLLGQRAEDIASTLADRGEQMVEQISMRSHELIETFVQTNESVNRRIDQAAVDVTKSLDGKAREITDAVRETGQTLVIEIVERGNDVRKTMESAQTALRTNLDSGAEQLSTSILTTGRTVTEMLASRTMALTDSLRQAGEDVTHTIATQGDNITSRIETVGSVASTRLVESGERLANDIAASSNKLEELIAVRGPRVARDLTAAAEGFSKSLEVQVSEARNLLEDTAQSFSATVKQEARQASDTLAESTSSLQTHLSEAASEAARTISLEAAQVNASIERSIEIAAHTLESQGSAFNTTLEKQSNVLQSTLGTNSKMLVDAMEQFNTQVMVRGENITSSFERSASGFASRIDERFGDLSNVFDVKGEMLETMITQKTFETGAFIEKRMTDFEARSIEAANTVTDRLDTIFIKIDDGLASRTQKMSEAVISNAVEAAHTISESAESVRVALEDRANRFEQVVLEQAGSLVGKMDESARSLTEQLTTRTNDLTATFDHGLMRMERDVVGRMGSLVATIDDRSRGLVNTIDERSRSLVETLNMRSEMVGAALGHQIEEISAIFNGRGTELVQQIRTNGEVITLAVAQSGEAANRQMAGVAEGILRSLEGQGQAITNAVRDQGSSVTAALQHEGQSVTEALRTQGQSVTEALRDHGHSLTESLRVQGHTVTKELREQGQMVTQQLRDQGGAVFDILQEQSATMTTELREQSETMLVTATTAAEQLRHAVEESSKIAVGRLVDVVDTLNTTSEPLVKRVADLTENLGDVVVRADSTLSQLDSVLQTRVGNIEQTLGVIYRDTSHAADRISQHVDVLRQATGTIADQMRSVSETTNSLARLESQISAAISSRETSLTQTMQHLSVQSDEFTTLSKSHAETVANALEDTERRAKEIGQLLSNSAISASDAISQQVESLRAMSQRERERLAAAVREVYETSLSDMTVATNSATERFRSTAEELVTVSNEVAQGLEKTRTELQRALVELPRDTREANDTVRALVSGQLKALDELKSLKQHTGLGVSQRLETPRPAHQQPVQPQPAPVQSQPVPPAYQPQMSQPVLPPLTMPEPVFAAPVQPEQPRYQEPVRAPEPVQYQEPARTPAPQRMPEPSYATPRPLLRETPVAPPVAPAPVFSAPVQQAPVSQPAVSQQPAQPAPMPSAAIPTAAIPPATSSVPGQSGIAGFDPSFAPRRATSRVEAPAAPAGPTAASGWLTDMLSRVSHEEQAAKPQEPLPASEWIAVLNRDINACAKQEMVLGFWERVLNGDRTATMAGVLTGTGHQKLEEARQRYHSEGDFRFVVDSFLGRFDELMRDVTPGDHGSSVIRTIMSSNEGKAYTLLCAAVGRIH